MNKIKKLIYFLDENFMSIMYIIIGYVYIVLLILFKIVL